jgi:hypothetical protein
MQYLAKSTLASVLLVILPTGHGLAQDTPAEAQPKPPKLFESNEILSITLRGPWRRLESNKSSDETFPGSLEYTELSGEQRSMEIGITTRGLTRRDRVCDFPPLKLWFDKDQNKGTQFRGQGSLKMVTHCQTASRWEQYYVKEYLSYRIFNLVTPLSFRVRPLTVEYVETEGNAETITRFGFLIEDIDDVAERNGFEELEVPRITAGRLDPVAAANVALFQYLIGNLDWSIIGGHDPVECCHNSKLVGAGPEDSPAYPIPYDLDITGLVNPHYGLPPDNLSVRNIRQRLYRGFCMYNDRIPEALERLRALRGEIIELFENEPRLEKRYRQAAIRYLEGFYDDLDKPSRVEKLLIDKCRN